MGLESGTFTDDLVTTNPPGTDTKSQGDDHLRLIKNCLRNTFKRASKAFSFPGVVSKSANYSVVATDENLTIECDTTSAFTLTLPATATINAGWAIYVVKKTTDANPVFLAPASGTINGFTKVRRSKEFHLTKVLWTGSVWIATRPHGLEIGTSHPFHGATLPNGYLWADGSAFNSANFVELNSMLGGANAPDLRGRAPFGKDNMGVGAANRIVGSSGIAGTTLGGSGGAEMHTLSAAQLATHTHSGNTGGHSNDHTHSGTTGGQSVNHTHDTFVSLSGTTSGMTSANPHSHTYQRPNDNNRAVSATGANTTANAGTFTDNTSSDSIDHAHNWGASGTFGSGGFSADHTHAFGTGGASANHTHAFTTNTGDGVSSTAHNNMPPTLICNYIVVAE